MAVYARKVKRGGEWVATEAHFAEMMIGGVRHRTLFPTRAAAERAIRRWAKGDTKDAKAVGAGRTKATPLPSLLNAASAELFRGTSPAYAKTMRAYQERFCAWAAGELGRGVSPDDPDVAMMARFQGHVSEELGKKPSSVNQNVVAVRLLLNWAHKHGFRAAPAPKVDPIPVENTRTVWLKPEEQDELLAKMREHGRHEEADFLWIAFNSGFRRGELLNGIKSDDINPFFVKDDDGKVRRCWGVTLRRQKNGKVTTQEVMPEVAELLQKKLPWKCTEATLRRALARAVRDLGWEGDERKHITLHGTRHSFATNLRRAGADIRDVQAALRHSSVVVTERYDRLVPGQVTAAIHKLRRQRREAPTA